MSKLTSEERHKKQLERFKVNPTVEKLGKQKELPSQLFFALDKYL